MPDTKHKGLPTKATVHLILATLGLATLNLRTSVVQAQDYTYTTNNGAITITKYIGPGGAVTVPSEIDGLPVRIIGKWAFATTLVTSVVIPDTVTTIEDGLFDPSQSAFRGAFSHCPLTNVTIGNGVTNIGTGAFRACSSLTSVRIGSSVARIESIAFLSCSSLKGIVLPDSVTSIGRGAFEDCHLLSSITIPKGVTSIGAAVVYACPSLTRISVDPLNPAYSSLDDVLFDKNQTSLLQYPGGKGGSYVIPNTVTGIAEDGFAGCSSLTQVAIPDSVASIGYGAFSNCGMLNQVTIGRGVRHIATWAFSYCWSLSAVYFRGNAPAIDALAFDHAYNATVFYLPGTIGWGKTFGDLYTKPWSLPYPSILASIPGYGNQPNAFSFRISWATNASVVVEACTPLISPTWSPLATNILTDGWSYFSDLDWTNYPSRFYRVRSL